MTESFTPEPTSHLTEAMATTPPQAPPEKPANSSKPTRPPFADLAATARGRRYLERYRPD